MELQEPFYYIIKTSIIPSLHMLMHHFQSDYSRTDAINVISGAETMFVTSQNKKEIRF